MHAGRDLRSLLGLLKLQKDTVGNPPYAPLLLRTLCVMAQHEGPSAFFDFAGGSAGIMRTTPLQLPTSKGYSFATWLRVESGLTDQAGSGGRSLYAMLVQGPDTKGVMAALVGNAQARCKQTVQAGSLVCSASLQDDCHAWWHNDWSDTFLVDMSGLC